jgi:hypothetical protein
MTSNFLKFALGIAAGISVILLLLMNEVDTRSLSKRIDAYEIHADSLRDAVKNIDASIRQKDSILLVYLASLDRTLEELDKESAKNKKAIKDNFVKQDSIRTAYCQEMAALQQNPNECQ